MSSAALPTPSLEAVYYATPIPSGLVSLTMLGIVFDRLHFPDVWLPESGYDPEATAAEAKRIEALPYLDLTIPPHWKKKG